MKLKIIWNTFYLNYSIIIKSKYLQASANIQFILSNIQQKTKENISTMTFINVMPYEFLAIYLRLQK